MAAMTADLAPQAYEETQELANIDQTQEYIGGDSGGSVPEYYALTGSHAGEDFSTLPSGILAARPKPRLTDEERLARDCMRRRQTDLDRRARIFDAKRRMIGVDKETLDAQVAEKQAQKEREMAVGNKGNRDMLMVDKQLKLIECQKQKQRREQEMHCKEFSLQNLHFESRREFDLNDPLYKRKGIPARVGDHDPRCGAASMQKFSGEDLMKAERVAQQRAEMVSFIEQQKFEKTMLSRIAPDDHAVQVEAVTQLRNEIEASEVSLRKELQRNQLQDNMDQARQNEERRQALVNANMDANEQELNFHAQDKMLNETRETHYNNRVIRDSYKGSSRQERVVVADQQREQRLQKEMGKAIEEMEDKNQEFAVESTRKQLIAMERDKARRKREIREQLAADNQKLQAEQKANIKHLNKIYRNEFSPEFFEQFGNGCR